MYNISDLDSYGNCSLNENGYLEVNYSIEPSLFTKLFKKKTEFAFEYIDGYWVNKEDKVRVKSSIFSLITTIIYNIDNDIFLEKYAKLKYKA